MRGDHSHGFVSGAEMTSTRNDSLYGSFRVGMKLSAASGTCGAFFWVGASRGPAYQARNTG